MNLNQLPLGEAARIAWSFRWTVIVPAVLTFTAATAFVTLQPDVYEAKVIFMSPLAKTSGAITGEITEASPRDVVRAAREYLLGTRLLSTIAEEIDPYPELRREQGFEAVLDRLRLNLVIEINNATGALTMAFRHSEGNTPADQAAAVANRLAELFIETQRDGISGEARANKIFLAKEEAECREALEAADRALEDFKRQHQGKLPEDVIGNRSLIFTHERSIENYIERQRRDRDMIESEKMTQLGLEQQRRAGLATMVARGVDISLDALKDSQFRIQQEREEKSKLYSEDSAEIRSLDEKLRELKERIAASEAVSGAGGAKDIVDYTLERQQRRQTELEEGIVRCDELIKETQAKIDELNANIAASTMLESRYLSLERDVDDAKKQRDSLRHRLTASKLEVDRRAYDPSTPVQIEQRAMAPTMPAGPGRFLTAVIGLVLGVLAGVVLLVLRNRLDLSFHGTAELRTLLPGTALVTIPDVVLPGRRYPKLLAGTVGGLVLLAIFVGAIGLLGVQIGWFDNPRMLEALRSLR